MQSTATAGIACAADLAPQEYQQIPIVLVQNPALRSRCKTPKPTLTDLLKLPECPYKANTEVRY
jgi:hypothetical protein